MADNRKDYTFRDYESIRKKLLEYLQAKFPNATNDFYEDHLLVVLVELMSYIGDMLSFYTDMAYNETRWDTVIRRENMLGLCKLLGYIPRGMTAATVKLKCTAEPYTGNLYISETENIEAEGGLVFQPIQNYIIHGDTSFEIEAVEGQLQEDVFYSDGTMNQEYKSVSTNVSYSYVPIVYVNGTEWERVKSLWGKTTGNYYELSYDNENKIIVRFGDGVHGNVPPNNAEIKIRYRTTNGSAGNLPIGKIDTNITGIDDNSDVITIKVLNEEPASGGSDGESVEEIRKNAPLYFQSLGVLVTTKNIEGACNAYSGVLASKIIVVEDLKFVRVIILADGYQTPTDTLLSDLESYIKERLVIGANLQLESVKLMHVNIGARVYIKRNYRADEVKARIEDTIQNFFTPEDYGTTENQIGRDIHYSDIVRLIDAIDGVDWVDVYMLTRQPEVDYVVWTDGIVVEDVNISETTTNETWTIEFINNTDYRVVGDIHGLQSSNGTLGVPYTTDNNELSFTINTNGASPNIGDYCYIKVGDYKGNVALEDTEYALKGTIELTLDYSD